MGDQKREVDRETISLFIVLLVLTGIFFGGLHWALNAPLGGPEVPRAEIPASK